MLTLYLGRGLADGCVTLQFPATPADIGEAFAALDNISTDAGSTLIRDVSCPLYEVERYVRDADIRRDTDVKSLNALAHQIDAFDNNQRTLLSGALEIEPVGSLNDIIGIMENISVYSYFPDVTTERELGIYLVESGMMPFEESVQPYLDYERIGIEYHANHSGAFMDTGYVTRQHEEPLQRQDFGMRMQ